MDGQVRSYGYDQYNQNEDDMDVRKGPWTSEEDAILSRYIAMHGEGQWNAVARSAGLKRTGKSCRLRWLNYLRPDVRRGNITLQEQLLILELHSRWGNRWSKMAQYLPGRTDNEIKNYWRTRVQKQAKQLKCDVNSKQFRDAMRYVWMPRIMERIRASESASDQPNSSSTNNQAEHSDLSNQTVVTSDPGSQWSNPNFMPELFGSSSESLESQVSGNAVSGLTDQCENENPATGYYANRMQSRSGDWYPGNDESGCWGWYGQQGIEHQSMGLGGEESLESLWNDDKILFLQQQLM